MAVLPASKDYTDRDFDSIRARLRNLIQGVFPDWTDESVADFGNILVELVAHVGDIIAFYQDNNARESRLSTAAQRKNLIALAKLIGYSPDTATAATTDVTVTLATAPGAEFELPIGQVVKTQAAQDPVEFQLLEPLTIPAGQVQGTALAEHSTTHDEQFPSTGLPNQTYTLEAVPYLDASAVVTAADGTYTEVENFLDSESTDRHFVIVVDQNDRATLKFGNGVNGSIPAGTVTVEYKTGGGSVGNLEAGALKVIDGAFTDAEGNPVVIEAVTSAEAGGGANRTTKAQIRQLAPEQLRTLTRTVSREDYEINAKRLPEVARALMLTADQDNTIAENFGLLFVVPTGGGAPTQAVKDAVKVQVTETYPNTITFQVEVRDAEYLDIDVAAKVYLQSGTTEATVAKRIRDNLAAFFALENADGSENPNVRFGFAYKNAQGSPAGEIALSDLYNVVRDTNGVRKIGDNLEDFELNGEHADVALGLRKFPTLGTVTLINGATGQNM